MNKIEEIAENMRSPKLRDIRSVSDIKNDVKKEIKLISNLTGLSEAELDELEYKEYKILQNKLSGFLS